MNSMMFQNDSFRIYCNYKLARQQIKMGLYDYNKVFQDFQIILEQNSLKAASKKAEYLERIVSIFTQFVKKCQKQIDSILDKKIDKLSQNYNKVKQYMKAHEKSQWMTKVEKDLLIAEFLIKPFERFPFSGNKNQKIFKEQYNLIEKASVLIEQTLIDSFNQDEVPTFNNNFFKTIENQGLGAQSLTKLRLNPQNFRLKHVMDINPVMTSAKSVKILHQNLALVVGDSQNVQVWNLQKNICLKQFYVQVKSSISTFCKVTATKLKNQIQNQNQKGFNVTSKVLQKQQFLVFGFSDELPQIWAYRMDNWKRYAHNVTHTRKITKILQMGESNYLISGGADGNLCVHSFSAYKIKTLVQAPHVSPIQDIIQKNNYIYLLMKCSTVCQYEVTIVERINPNPNLENLNENVQNLINLQFRRTLSTGYISMIRFPELTSNFSGVACHIYGLSQIQITRKFKLEQVNIINVVQMISDFIVLQSKETSQFFAICIFQNSSTIRIYSLLSQEVVYEISNDDYNEVGVAGYLPKIQIFYSIQKKCYVIVLVLQSERPNERNILRIYDLII